MPHFVEMNSGKKLIRDGKFFLKDILTFRSGIRKLRKNGFERTEFRIRTGGKSGGKERAIEVKTESRTAEKDGRANKRGLEARYGSITFISR